MKENLNKTAFVIAIGWLLFRSFGLYINDYLKGWEFMSPWAILFLLPPLVGAFTSYYVGNKFDKRVIGMIGFYASTILFDVWPGLFATLVVLYSVTNKPLVVTSIWTGIASIVAILPMAYYLFFDMGDLLYAGAFGIFLVATTFISCVLFITSLVCITVHFVKKMRARNRRISSEVISSDLKNS